MFGYRFRAQANMGAGTQIHKVVDKVDKGHIGGQVKKIAKPILSTCNDENISFY